MAASTQLRETFMKDIDAVVSRLRPYGSQATTELLRTQAYGGMIVVVNMSIIDMVRNAQDWFHPQNLLNYRRSRGQTMFEETLDKKLNEFEALQKIQSDWDELMFENGSSAKTEWLVRAMRSAEAETPSAP